MKKLICTLIAIAGICSAAMAQTKEKWYVAPSASASAVGVIGGSEGGWAYGLTLGRYITKANDIRIDLQGNYIAILEGNDRLTVSAIAMTESKVNIFGWDKLYSSSGLGVGMLAPAGRSDVSENMHTDVIIPFKTVLEYRVIENVSFGIDMSYSLNIRSPKTMGPINFGLFFGFRF